MGNDFETIINCSNEFPVRAYAHGINSYKFHWHTEFELLLVVKGSISVFIDKEQYILKENDITIINSTEAHSTNRLDGENLVIGIHLSPAFGTNEQNMENLYFNRSEFMKDQAKDPQMHDNLRNFFVKIFWEMNKKSEGYEYMVNGLMNSFISYLIRGYYLHSAPKGNDEQNKSRIQILGNIKNYVNTHYAEKVSLEDLANKEHINYYYLSHLFKDSAGISFREYLNSVRLEKSLEFLKKDSRSISQIALECGFSSTKSYNKVFAERFGVYPNEYRKNNTADTSSSLTQISFLLGNENKNAYSSLNSKEGLSIIFNKFNTEKLEWELSSLNKKREYIKVNLKDSGQLLEHYWSKLTTFGRANEGLRKALQEQLSELQRSAPFQYARFHGIFSDDMMVFNLSNTGEVKYNWLYVDELFDFLLSINLKPFVELSFMPSEIASENKTVFWWRGNYSKPKDIKLWTDMVAAFVRHCINRYGLKEVVTWYFEVWNEPDYTNCFYVGTQEDYFELYKATVLAIKEIHSSLRVGGPAITHIGFKTSTWMRNFTVYCEENSLPLDFLSFHIYCDDAQVYAVKGEKIFPAIPRRRYLGKGAIRDVVDYYDEITRGILDRTVEYHVSEWNISPEPRFLLRDTAFMAPFIIENVLDCKRKPNSLGYWTYSDLMEELKAPLEPFHGGLGLVNQHGIRKPAYYAYHFLSKLGDKLIKEGEGYIVTKKDSSYQVLLYNAAKFDSFAIQGDLSSVTMTQRYTAFREDPDKIIHLTLNGISGNYKITRYDINRQWGSSFDEWCNMGAPDILTNEETEYLKKKAYPKMTVSRQRIDKECTEDLHLPLHGCTLILYEPEL